MKILLVGEYNSSHKTLKDGLVALGHEVTVVGLGDGFKKRMVDVNFEDKYTSGLPLFLKKVWFRLFKTDLTSLSIKKQFFRNKSIFENNDIVQLINENSFQCLPPIERDLLRYIFDHNPNVFLLSCGTDHLSVTYAMEKKFRYSILTPYFEQKGNLKLYQPILKYITPPYKALHQFIYSNIKGIIASDLDYHIPLLGDPKYLGLAPNPIDLSEIAYIPMDISDKIHIFHGINRANYYKKGNDLFEAALAIIQKKYPEKVKITTVVSVPYNEYIKAYDKAHILLDQVYAYDQGFNALEGMAKGKVVFTGAEQEWLDYHGLEADTVAINALPDPESIAEKLVWLIENPEKITEISKNAREFVTKYHDHKVSAKNYLDKWQSAI
ncbi:glycosyltransferase [Constantimarinum furrinae]|nr:glycosyltransferase [Constantimarinum furrinae]